MNVVYFIEKTFQELLLYIRLPFSLLHYAIWWLYDTNCTSQVKKSDKVDNHNITYNSIYNKLINMYWHKTNPVVISIIMTRCTMIHPDKTRFVPVTHCMLFVGVCRWKSVSRIRRIIDRSAPRYVKGKEKMKEGPWLQKSSFPNWLAIPRQIRTSRWPIQIESFAIYCRNDHHDALFESPQGQWSWSWRVSHNPVCVNAHTRR